MNRITSTAVRFLSFVMLAAVCLHTVPAFAGSLITTDADVDCSNTDLLQTQFDGFTLTAGTHGSAGEPTVRDGVALTSSGYASAHLEAWTGDVWTYTLNTSVNTLGYDLSQVNVYHGYVNDDRDGLQIKVEFSRVDAETTFYTLYDMGSRHDPASNYGKIGISAEPMTYPYVDPPRGVKMVRITITDPQNGQAAVSEIDVLGTPTVAPTPPNPSPGGVISINFTHLGDSAAVLGSADVAGVLPRANWNNFVYNTNTFDLNPKDDTGTTLASTYVSYRVGYFGNHGYTPSTPNDRLMRYYIGDDEGIPGNGNALIRVSGLPTTFTANGYSIYVYTDWISDNNFLRRIILGTSSLAGGNPGAAMTTILASESLWDSTSWQQAGVTTFTEGAFGHSSGPVVGSVGNYVVFRNRTGNEFTLDPSGFSGNGRTGINGIQIVANQPIMMMGSALIVR